MKHARVSIEGQGKVGMGIDVILNQVLKHVSMAVHKYVVEDEAPLGVPLAEHALSLARPPKEP